MSPRALVRLLGGYALVLIASAWAVRAVVRLDPQHVPSATRIVSEWVDGRRVSRAVIRGESLPGATAAHSGGGCIRTVERIVDEGPLPVNPAWLLGLSIAAGRDGIAVRLGEHTTYFTPEDLLSRQVSRDGMTLGKLQLRIGLDSPAELLDSIARELNVSRSELSARARLTRFIVRREDAAAEAWPMRSARANAMTPAVIERSVRSGADYLVRAQAANGSFVYQLDAVSGTDKSEDNLPRHGGTTLFVAEVAAQTRDPKLTAAALQAARLVQREYTVDCGSERCIGSGDRIAAGSVALNLLAYVELARSGVGGPWQAEVRALAKFLRGLQRPDGEFMHFYNRRRQRPMDVQVDYFTGEIVLALARAHRITRDPADLEAARAGLRYLTRRTLFQNRYLFGSEHWTCQALEELWDRAPDRSALEFCLDLQAFNRQFQVAPFSELGDYEGGIAPNPFAPPRITATGSRNEAAVATLSTALAAGVSALALRELNLQVRRSIAFMLRFQLRPGPRHLLRDPARAEGGLPGSPTDLRVRIDFIQHASAGVLRYLTLLKRHPELSR